jgi:hypothetical protein
MIYPAMSWFCAASPPRRGAPGSVPAELGRRAERIADVTS